jgi:ComF family protein
MFHNTIWNAYQTLITTLLPTFCSSCRAIITSKAIFCPACFSLIEPITSKTLALTSSYSLTVFAVAPYQSPLKELILAKRHGMHHASRQLACLMVAMTPIKTLPIDLVVPIPLHWTRHMWRGYNQAHIMAEVIAHARKAHLMPLLHRHKRTPFLSSLKPVDRFSMVNNAFSARARYTPDQIEGKHIVLVDDLMTTGSTLKSAALCLLPFKPASLQAVVACRVS